MAVVRRAQPTMPSGLPAMAGRRTTRPRGARRVPAAPAGRTGTPSAGDRYRRRPSRRRLHHNRSPRPARPLRAGSCHIRSLRAVVAHPRRQRPAHRHRQPTASLGPSTRPDHDPAQRSDRCRPFRRHRNTDPARVGTGSRSEDGFFGSPSGVGPPAPWAGASVFMEIATAALATAALASEVHADHTPTALLSSKWSPPPPT